MPVSTCLKVLWYMTLLDKNIRKSISSLKWLDFSLSLRKYRERLLSSWRGHRSYLKVLLMMFFRCQIGNALSDMLACTQTGLVHLKIDSQYWVAVSLKEHVASVLYVCVYVNYVYIKCALSFLFQICFVTRHRHARL